MPRIYVRKYNDAERKERHNAVSRNYRVLHRQTALRSGRVRNHKMRGCVVTQEEYERILAAPTCALCGVEFVREPVRNPKAPVLDHCHLTGRPRKALCRRCNMGLGHFHDSVEMLLKAVEYLKGYL